MTQSTITTGTKRTLPVMGQKLPSVDPQLEKDLAGIDLPGVDIDAELARFEEAERERLGIHASRRQWADTMIDPQFKKSERERVTMLMGGLTNAQDFLAEGALRGVGYKARSLDAPDNAGLQLGKEYGNRGQCNPTYFTVGNLIKELVRLRDEEGLTSKEVVDNYIFMTAGACGPCRFGMYVTEYRKALRDAGFDGFRVMLFQQKGGLSQATGEDVGLEMNPEFFIAIIKSVVVGDVLNATGYRIRPYEVEEGATDRAIEECKRICYEALLNRTNIFAALVKCRRVLAAIEVDKLRPKPKVSIIGEFWAMTTEGDGNYQLQKFLESEGAENDIQLTTAWLLYNIWEVSRDTREREDLRVADGGESGLADFQGELDVAKRLAAMRLAELGLRVGFQAFAQPTGLHGYHLPDMEHVAEVANAHYSNDLRGGEGHMEVGKLIVNVVNSKAHMTVSVKPFGCMPSSGVSDGVQSLITTKYPGTIFCAVETSGDGATNFYSRVQMYLYKARIAAEEEKQRVLEECGVTEEEVRAFLDKNPKYKSPLHHSPHVVAGSAGNLIHEVAPFIKQSRLQRASTTARKAAVRVRELALTAPGTLAEAGRKLADPDFREAAMTDLQIITDLARGQAKEIYGPLVKRLMARAYFGTDAGVEEQVSHDEPLAAE